MGAAAKVTSKGQITRRAEFRAENGIESKDEIVFAERSWVMASADQSKNSRADFADEFTNNPARHATCVTTYTFDTCAGAKPGFTSVPA
jgi:bifunctional DNA-binding transcriptional regulator/antitoxin component of YhaV-PrlF toxin-antitoxin module